MAHIFRCYHLVGLLAVTAGECAEMTLTRTMLELVATEVAAQSKNSQDALVVHGKLLIGSTLHT